MSCHPGVIAHATLGVSLSYYPKQFFVQEKMNKK